MGQVDGLIKETGEEVNFILGRNGEIQEVNGQLKQDLKVCERHMENVLRANRYLEEEI